MLDNTVKRRCKKRPKTAEIPQEGESRLSIITWHGYLYVIYEYYKATR